MCRGENSHYILISYEIDVFIFMSLFIDSDITFTRNAFTNVNLFQAE